MTALSPPPFQAGPQAIDTAELNFARPTPAPAGGRARRWLVLYPRAIPLAIFLAIAAITALSVFAIESNARARERAVMREYAQSIAAALDRSSTSFSSYLRAGAALFASSADVRPETFDNFVRALRLDMDYPGAEGIGWLPVIETPDLPGFMAQARARQPDFPEIYPKPVATTGRIAPVTMFAPASARNRRALGYDMYSDPARAAAMAEAELARRPTASGRIVLEQEQSGNLPAFAIYTPVFRTFGADDRRLIGFVYTPFRAGEFLDSAIDRKTPEDFGVRLYDGEASTGHLLVAHSISDAASERVEEQVTIANRRLLLVVESANQHMLAPLSMVTLVFGLALASLLMLLARLLTQQAYEDQSRLAFFEEQHSIRNSLTRELNHRVKNTLANVLSILSLTRRRTSDLDEFADSLEGRIRALSATHDLLTVTDWGTTPIRAVIEAELQHFRLALDDAILLDGPPLELAPNDALSFGLAIHELATNAAKYGALSVAGGEVTIRWQMAGDHLAEVEWRESGGPPVATERHRGFGTELIEKIVAHELRQPVALDFRPEGVVCKMLVPIRRPADFRIREGV
ncbi:CHASE domain-containing protein [Erythrobacter sanguineus]|uniref:histidine kinase n=1 Tax=Erythrobacter sanguineus TaxID=198312 RepID=A0A1M7SNH1_9SPHN|nr:CHASE domain-containing protein [Erythrobacter sanguineus]SHN60037.1 signal transduction histidine kinase [Erythrobacter sanguineus]